MTHQYKMSQVYLDRAQDIQQSMQCNLWKKAPVMKRKKRCAEKKPELVKKYETKVEKRFLNINNLRKRLDCIDDCDCEHSDENAPELKVKIVEKNDFDENEWIIIDALALCEPVREKRRRFWLLSF